MREFPEVGSGQGLQDYVTSKMMKIGAILFLQAGSDQTKRLEFFRPMIMNNGT